MNKILTRIKRLIKQLELEPVTPGYDALSMQVLGVCI